MPLTTLNLIRELNLPSIALRLSLGLNRLRLSIVYRYYTLRSACSIFLCYTEQLSSLVLTIP